MAAVTSCENILYNFGHAQEGHGASFKPDGAIFQWIHSQMNVVIVPLKIVPLTNL